MSRAPLPLRRPFAFTGGPLKHAQDLNAAYLLSLDPDRMLAFYRMRAGLEPKARRLHRLGRRRPAADRTHRRTSPLGRQPDVGRDRRRALQAARRLHRLRAEDRAGQARRRLCRRAARRARGVRRGVEGQHPLGELRSQRSVVALVHAAQDFRRAARRLSPHRQQDRARHRDQVRAMGRALPRADERRADSAHARAPSSAA